MLRQIIQTRSLRTRVIVVLAALAAAISVAAWTLVTRRASVQAAAVSPSQPASEMDDPVEARRRADFAAMQTFRPGYAFWQHIFTIPDGSIAFGRAADGRLLATFPAKGDWTRDATWADPTLAPVLEGEPLARKLGDRREQVAQLLERAAGPVIHNATRGDALIRNARKYGPFVAEWGNFKGRIDRRATVEWLPAANMAAALLYEDPTNAITLRIAAPPTRETP